MKNSFLLYPDQKEIWELLTPEQCKELILAIYNFDINPNPELSPTVKLASISIFKQLLRDAAKWETIREKRAKAGRIGGQISSKSKIQANQANASSGNGQANSKRVANQAVTVTDTVTVTVNDNVINRGVGETPLTPPKKKHASETDELPKPEDILSLSEKLRVDYTTVANYKESYMSWVQGNDKYKWGRHMKATVANWIRRDLKEGKIQKSVEAQLQERFGNAVNS